MVPRTDVDSGSPGLFSGLTPRLHIVAAGCRRKGVSQGILHELAQGHCCQQNQDSAAGKQEMELGTKSRRHTNTSQDSLVQSPLLNLSLHSVEGQANKKRKHAIALETIPKYTDDAKSKPVESGWRNGCHSHSPV